MRRWLTYDRLVVATKPKTRDSPLVMMFALATALFAHTSPSQPPKFTHGQGQVEYEAAARNGRFVPKLTENVLAEENYSLLVCHWKKNVIETLHFNDWSIEAMRFCMKNCCDDECQGSRGELKIQNHRSIRVRRFKFQWKRQPLTRNSILENTVSYYCKSQPEHASFIFSHWVSVRIGPIVQEWGEATYYGLLL